jgi:hypothetical protein
MQDSLLWKQNSITLNAPPTAHPHYTSIYFSWVFTFSQALPTNSWYSSLRGSTKQVSYEVGKMRTALYRIFENQWSSPALFPLLFTLWTSCEVCPQNCEKQLWALSCLSVCLSVTTQLPMDVFSWNFKSEYLWKSVKKIQCVLKYDENNGYFTWRHTYICGNIWMNPS